MVISFDYSWFLAKNLSNFVSLPWKLYNQYCHTVSCTSVYLLELCLNFRKKLDKKEHFFHILTLLFTFKYVDWMICMWQWITVIKEYSFVQSLKCFEKVNNYDIEYKLQSRMLSHQVTSYYAREKNKYISYYVWGSDDKFSHGLLNIKKSMVQHTRTFSMHK